MVGSFDNSALMDEIVALRHELAQLLDFNNYAEYSLATKMAESPDKVIEFLEDLAARSKPQGRERTGGTEGLCKRGGRF